MAVDDRAFTYDLTTTRGQVRLALTDTREPGVFSDDEIDHFLSIGGSVDGATARGLKVLLVDAARRTRLYSREGESYNDTAQVQAIKTAIDTIGGSGAYPSVKVSMTAALPWEERWDDDNP